MNSKFLTLKTLGIFVVIVFTAFIFACNSTDNKVTTEDDLEVNPELMEDLNKAKQVFYSLPSPIETAMLIKRAGAKYNEEFLNKIENISKYSTNKSMALNLGVYSADLSFASMFDQPQASIKYLSTCKKLADDLGILNAIDKGIIDRMDKNVNNRDSLMEIISETLMNSNSFLKENDRPETAAIILVGAWVEGLYIATKIAKTSNSNKELVDRIVDQRLSLNTLLSLLEEYKDGNSKETVNELLSKLGEINSVFEKIQITTTKVETSVDNTTNVTTLNSKTKIAISPEVFDTLCVRVDNFRTEITN
ncbi:MAG: hypothetical protein A2W98_05930 [Bacteroidetes bacterium GWF2_33_38]|nr:MAG: hypothetical protein A2W98_05930 [Bacteroidetes bacterium GWF2_33_38]OFY68636.1 MAG: hypothetical protein A2265_09215 [Bacteroidetes bacterium RIFOXYA12_FULL_33_9]OFY91948.1 MAG: hypothetical protein A2236_02130 [Bacteroidetes bacterium RIFOXYA2_FULL_33_7]HBX49602.1 hypothetical protein [Bacteroidales bacterium]